jgi:hypothetical protein
LADLIGKKTEASIQTLNDIVAARGCYRYHGVRNYTEATLYFQKLPVAAYTFAFQEIVKVAEPHATTFGLIRYIANELKGDYLQQARDYLQRNASVAATTQIKFLSGDIDITMSTIKSLPLDRAIWELTHSFRLNAVGSLSALLDLRQEQLAAGQNDVDAIDTALLEGVRKLVTTKKALLGEIREGNPGKMKVFFGRLAEAGVADIRERFNVAAQIVASENELKALNARLTDTLARYPEKKIA